MKIDKEILDELNTRFLGKRITVENKNGKFTGICNFIGHNEFFPSFGLQVTLDRTPVTNVKIGSIKLVEDLSIFKK